MSSATGRPTATNSSSSPWTRISGKHEELAWHGPAPFRVDRRSHPDPCPRATGALACFRIAPRRLDSLAGLSLWGSLGWAVVGTCFCRRAQSARSGSVWTVIFRVVSSHMDHNRARLVIPVTPRTVCWHKYGDWFLFLIQSDLWSGMVFVCVFRFPKVLLVQEFLQDFCYNLYMQLL